MRMEIILASTNVEDNCLFETAAAAAIRNFQWKLKWEHEIRETLKIEDLQKPVEAGNWKYESGDNGNWAAELQK